MDYEKYNYFFDNISTSTFTSNPAYGAYSLYFVVHIRMVKFNTLHLTDRTTIKVLLDIKKS